MATSSRVLIVEDESELLDEVASYFRRRGETVLTAACYNDGLKVIENESAIDVLVSDARMPDGNGIDLIRAQTRRNKDCVCILMTGHLEQSQIASDLHGIKIFFKPFAVSALYREVRAALSGGVVTDISRASAV
jgi:DNA-binding NtrC family response regulator